MTGSALALALATAACSSAPAGAGATSGSAGSTPAGPGATATISSGSSAGGADNIDYCGLFTAAEIGATLGQAVGAGEGSGFVCTWTATNGSATASVYRSLAGLYEDAAAQPDFRAVSGIGDKAAIGPSVLGGTEAIAVANDAYWLVRLDPSPSDDALLGFLRQLISRGQ
jgi:hypothetical protein